MSTLDFHDMSATMRHMISGLVERNIPGPLYVSKGGQQIAVIIRAEAYAPKLDKFRIIPGDDTVYLTCKEPLGPQCEYFVMCDGGCDLDTMLKAANEHWNDTHREPRQ